MPEYRIYVIDGRNHIAQAHDYVGSDDWSALYKAYKLRNGGAAEVWQSARSVSRIPKGDEGALQRDGPR